MTIVMVPGSVVAPPATPVAVWTALWYERPWGMRSRKSFSRTCERGGGAGAGAEAGAGASRDGAVGTGSAEARRHAAGALWNLATSAESKAAVVLARGIPPLVGLLADADALPEAVECAAALISELARSQNSNRALIADAGGIAPLIASLSSDSALAQKHACKYFETSAIRNDQVPEAFSSLIARIVAQIPNPPEPSLLLRKRIQIGKSLAENKSFRAALFDLQAS